MQITVDEYKGMKPICLPFKCKETDFVLTSVDCMCSTCGSIATELRGDIYESFGVVEISVSGVCSKCGLIIKSRARVNPKRGVFSQETDGIWIHSNIVTEDSNRSARFWRVFNPLMGIGCFMVGLWGMFKEGKEDVYNLMFWVLVVAVVSAVAGKIESMRK